MPKTKTLETLDSSYYTRGGKGYKDQMEEFMDSPKEKKAEDASYRSMDRGPSKGGTPLKYKMKRKDGESLSDYRKRLDEAE